MYSASLAAPDVPGGNAVCSNGARALPRGGDMTNRNRVIRLAWAGALTATALVQGCDRPRHDDRTPSIAAAPPTVVERRADFAGQRHSADATRVADWVVRADDSHGQPFAVIDKPEARLYVFDAAGRLVGAAPVLLGAAKSDDTVPGIGDKPIPEVKPEERTTPAGRFVAEHGTNLRKEHVIWIDYDAAVSMHPVLTTNPAERRLDRLEATDPEQHRISYGCVNVPTQFFSDVVLKTLGPVPNPVVYVLPDVKPLAEVFPGLASGPVARADAGVPPVQTRVAHPL